MTKIKPYLPSSKEIYEQLAQSLEDKHVGRFVNFVNGTGLKLDEDSMIIALLAMNHVKLRKAHGKAWNASLLSLHRYFMRLFAEAYKRTGLE